MNEARLPDKVERLLADFVNRTKDIYRDELASVILYGSAASGEYSAKHSNVNIALILRDTSLASLSRIAPLLNKYKFRSLNAVFFTEAYIKNSTDVFPIEFLDMKENHKILYGNDLLTALKIDIKNLRFQCEQELKSKILNMKRAYLAHIKDSDLDRLLLKLFTSSLHVLRNILRLKKGSVAYRKEEILDGIAAEFHIDTSGMKKIWAAKAANRRLPRKEAAALFNSFVNDLEKISYLVDGL